LIVVDASLIADFLIETADRPEIVAAIVSQERLAAPALIQYEVGNILRRHNIIGELSEERSGKAFADSRTCA
jgi:predicted nucleic acid-binding protein